MPDSGKKNFSLKLGFYNIKVRHFEYKRDPPWRIFNGGHFLIQGYIGVHRGYLSQQFKKCWFSTGAQTVLIFAASFFIFQLLYDWFKKCFIALFDRRLSRDTSGVKCWKLGVFCQITISLQIFSNIIFATRHT